MSRYIDADKLTKAFVKAAKQVGNIGDQIAFRMMINEIPAADVRENVKGEWLADMIYDGEDEWCFLECSNCKYRSDDHFNYCPNCGADMRGDS